MEYERQHFFENVESKQYSIYSVCCTSENGIVVIQMDLGLLILNRMIPVPFELELGGVRNTYSAYSSS